MSLLDNSNHTGVHMDTHFCYESVNGSCKAVTFSQALQFSMYLFMVLLILVTVSGNLLVISTIAYFKQFHTSTNYLLMSMALCDLFLGVLIMPCSALRSVQGCWFMGDLACKFHTSTDIMLSTSSIFHLSFISMDRYFAVCSPLMYEVIINSTTTLAMVATSWVIPALFAYVLIFFELNLKGREVFYKAHVECYGGCHVFFSPPSAIVASMFSFFIPGFIMVAIYIKIFLVARNQVRLIKDLEHHFPAQQEDKSKIHAHRERKVAFTFAMILGVFLICWFPFFLCTLLNPFLDYSISPVLIDALVWFGYMNSGLNPLVYAFFYTWFRKALRTVFSGDIFHRNLRHKSLFSE